MEKKIKSLNVLIVEDDDMTRKLLVIEFKKKGHNVLEYADASAAIEDIEREKYEIDAAVIDLMNMGYGGNLGDYLRKFIEYKETVIVYYTALTQQLFNTKILDYPNTYFIHKVPGSLKKVVEKIEEECL
ncbi:response regulator [bacterium]|nr:response regulator [bacterium]